MGLAERFNAKFIPVPESGCWIWVAAVDGRGYGAIQVNGGCRRSHRISWELHRSPIPAGMCVLHKCDTPLCVNPDHLFLGTDADNAADRSAKGRTSRGAAHSAAGAGSGSGACGERHYAAKLTKLKVLAIRADTRPETQIAADYGIARSTVGQIKRGERWPSAAFVAAGKGKKR